MPVAREDDALLLRFRDTGVEREASIATVFIGFPRSFCAVVYVGSRGSVFATPLPRPRRIL